MTGWIKKLLMKLLSKRLLPLISIWFTKYKLPIYSLIVVSIFSFGSYVGYNAAEYLNKEDTKKPFKAEQGLIDDQKGIEIVYKDRVKEVIKYVEKTGDYECFTPDDIRVFNNE